MKCCQYLVNGLLLVFAITSCKLNAQKYFQQEVNYTIHASLNDSNHTLSCTENIEYINNSPDTLHFLYFHLWPNAYKNNQSQLAKQLLENGSTFMYTAPESYLGYIDSITFKINDTLAKHVFLDGVEDICKIFLNRQLLPGDTVSISTPFFVKIPDSRISRLGHEGQSYQITQWYPKPAVYDAHGWNAMPYLDQGEFYSEFGSFNVFITLPENYVVGATGDLIGNPEETLWLEKKSDSTKKINSFNQNDIAFPPSSDKKKTLHFYQKNIHDFAWFADKRYHVIKSEVELPYSKRKVDTWLMFTNKNAELWKNASMYINNAIYLYSDWVGEYPYNQATAVEGALSAGGGMEYPNITVISSGSDSITLEMVIIHEVGHNWFYGILGSNERKFPWMDEGINSFYDYRCLQKIHPGSTMFLYQLAKIIRLPETTPRIEREFLYLLAARTKIDQAANLSSEKYTSLNYGGIVYEKVAVGLYSLMEYLGETKYDSVMKIYFDSWKFKHPQPKDLEKVFTENCKKNTTWFFNDFIETTGTIDYAIKGLKKKHGTEPTIKIKNKGNIAAPFELTFYKNKELISSQWIEGFTKVKSFPITPVEYDQIKINSKTNFPEINRKNNAYRKGIFRKTEPLRLQPIMNFEDPNHTQLFYAPAIGYNCYNGFMAGVALYNGIIPAKKFQYQLIPLYGTHNKNITGISHLEYSSYFSKSLVHSATLSNSFSTFAYADNPKNLTFYRNNTSLDVFIRNKNPRSPVSQIFSFRFYSISKEILKYIQTDEGNISTTKHSNYYISQVIYNYSNKRILNPFSFDIIFEQNSDFMKSSFTFSQKFNYTNPRKSLDFRAFAGTFIYSKPNTLYDFRFRMSGTTGAKDHLFSNYFVGRSEGNGVFSQQFSETDGAFKSPTILGQTSEWMLTVNIKTSMPGKIPFKLFLDVGACDKVFINNAAIIFDAGISIPVFPKIFEIYVPLFFSKALQDNFTLNKTTFAQKIRFTLQLEKLNPFSLVKSIK